MKVKNLETKQESIRKHSNSNFIVKGIISLNFHINSKHKELVAFHDELDGMRNNVNEINLEKIRIRVLALALDVKNGNR